MRRIDSGAGYKGLRAGLVGRSAPRPLTNQKTKRNGVFPSDELCDEIAGREKTPRSQVVVLLEPSEAHFCVRLVSP